jgi:hypothetical protein
MDRFTGTNNVKTSLKILYPLARLASSLVETLRITAHNDETNGTAAPNPRAREVREHIERSA